MLSHGNLHSNAASLKEAWGFSSDDVLLHALPIFHIHGLFVATNVTMLSGACMMLFLPKFEPDAIFAALPRRDRDDGRADFLYPPAQGPAPVAADDAGTCACSFPARRPCCRRPSGNGRRAPITPCWNAMA